MGSDTNDTVRVAFESRAVCFIQCFRKFPDGKRCGPATATGFYWSNGDQLYLVTNWHSVTGQNADTLCEIGSFTPTHLHVWFNEMIPGQRGEGRNVKFVGKEVSLYEDDEPTWMEHPQGRLVDVVAIPLAGYAWKGKVYTVNQKHQYKDYSPMVGDDCFIVGYPDGFIGPNGTPIWKRASIATEPELDYDQKPLFLADSLTRKGMSGSPVFAKVSGLWGQEGESVNIGGEGANYLGYWTKFIGVYAGREGADKEGFQLARVWKNSAMEEIIRHGVKPKPPPFK